ncbi:hypothetical protein [Herbidospora cretacea]|uniref:hypothetical protein n=1 Tax=Herbidospora cretacea TaxID=28444 RepID=UPI0004C2C09C|nr:hypothetical protein [Herbidospora cretacea]
MVWIERVFEPDHILVRPAILPAALVGDLVWITHVLGPGADPRVTHVASVMAKTGCANRIRPAVPAVEHGLA